jgi:ferredoxin
MENNMTTPKKEESLKDLKKEEIKLEEQKKKQDEKKDEKKKEPTKDPALKGNDEKKKLVIEDEENLVIKDEVPKESCFKGFSKCLGRCCTGCGRCFIRFLYCLFSDRAMIIVNVIAVAAIFVSIAERLSWVKYQYIPFA